MPWVKISSEAHKDMKQYLVDIEGLNLGELAGTAFEFAMEHLEEFEKLLGLEESQDTEETEGNEEGEADSESDNEED